MRKEQITEIDDITKEELLNQLPDTNKGEIKVPKKKKGRANKEEGVISLSEEELNNPENVETPASLGEQDFSFLDDPNRPEEKDYSLPVEEFNDKYFKERPKRERSNVDSNIIRNESYDVSGKGVEDYRKYIENPMHNVNLDYTRAIKQSNWAKAGNGAIRFLFNVIPETVQQASNVVEAVYNVGYNLFSERESYGNPIYDFTKDIKEAVNNEFNIYLKNPSENMAVGEFGWWADRTSNLATSVAAFIALGYATGGSAVGTRIANLIGRSENLTAQAFSAALKGELAAGTKFSEVVKIASMGKGSVSYATLGDALFNSYILTSSESMGISVELYNKVKKDELKSLLHKGYSKEYAEKESNRRAMRAGDRTFMFNQWNIALNMTSTMPFIRTPKVSGRIAKRTLLGGAKHVTLEGVQEAAEETVNLVAEKRATDEEYSFEKAMKDIATSEGAESAFLGFLGGFAQTGLTLTGQYIKKGGKSEYQEYLENYAIQEETLENLENLPTSGKVNEWSTYKSTSEQTKIHNEINKLNIDYQKATTTEEREAISKKLNDIQMNNFIKQAYDAFQYDLGDVFIEQLESIKKLTDEEAVKQGFDVSEENNYREILDKRINDIQELQKIYNYTKSLYRGEVAYDLMSNVYYYKNLQDNYKKDIEEKEQKYLEDIIEQYSKIEAVPYFNLSIEKGKVKRTEKEHYTSFKTKDNEKLLKYNEKIRKEKEKLSKNKEDSKETLMILEKELEYHKEEMKKLKDKEKTNNYSLDLIENSVKKSHKSLNTLISNYEFVTTKIKENEKKADEIVSVEGQSKAKKEYIESKKAYDKLQAKLKALQKQREKEEKRKKKERKEKVNETESTTEVDTEVDTEVESTTEEGSNIDILAPTTSEEVNINKIVEAFNLSEEETQDGGREIIQGVYDIFKHTNDISSRQDLIIGLLNKNFLNLETEATNKLTNLYNSLGKYNGEFSEYTAEQLINIPKVKEFTEAFKTISNSSIIAEKFDNIENFSFDTENEENEDDELASKKVAEELNRTKEQKEVREFGDWVEDVIEELGLTTSDSTDKIIKAISIKIGENATREIFYKIQGYLMYKDNKRRAKFFNTIIKTKKETKKEAELKEMERKAITIDNVDEVDIDEIDLENKEKVAIEILKEDGILIDLDTPYSDNYKALTLSRKLAFKVKVARNKYENGEIITIGNGKLNNVDNRVLTENGIKVGTKLNFRVKQNFKDKDGNSYITTKENGEYKTIFIDAKDGTEYEVNPLEHAPIQVYIGDSELKDVYLHLPSFINSEHIPYNKEKYEEAVHLLEEEKITIEELIEADMMPKILKEDVENEIRDLVSIREKVLKGENLEATVSKKGKGFFIEASIDTVEKNLPNALIAVYDGVSLITDNGRKITPESNKLVAGRTYALIPKGTTDNRGYTPYALYKNTLDSESIEVVNEMIRLKLMDKTNISPEDSALLKYYENNKLDLLDNTFEGYIEFIKVLKRFVPVRKITKDFNFKVAIEDYKNPAVFVGFINGKIVINVGAKNYNKFDSTIITTNEQLTKNLEGLALLLNSTLINIRKELIGKNNVFIPSINKGQKQLTSYNSYIKKRLSVNIKSINVDGEDVYRVQKSIHFEIEDEILNRKLNKKAFEEVENSSEPLNKKEKEKISKMVEKEVLEEISEEEKNTFLEGLEEDFEDDENEEEVFDNLDSFGIFNINNMEDTIDNLIEEDKIKGTDEEGKPCSI